MAKKSDEKTIKTDKKVEETVEEKAIIKVRALVNIKYDKDCFKIGDEFEVRTEDSEEMTKKGYVESLEKTEKGETKEGE
ncbi:DUF7210 family protein [Clostridium tepidum]|jgi:hypothetical protein|uniref:DUF7210 domain-containing protein n=1 Tax=Clostridium cochlearium TaxID=1494 RepID=A0A7Y3V559_CLOCO|nr:hypothetical protein [Clostridium cochlearium]MBU5268897.1 hypothetical protein [Clostridium cochlearium]NOH14868.1 hypothetical protein [Clostridium cochlearium]